MSISIRNLEVERLLAEIEAATGRGKVDLLLDLLLRERERLKGEKEREIAEGLEIDREIAARWNSRRAVDQRAPAEIVAYGEDGLPR